MDTGIRQGDDETRSERSARAPDVTGATLEELAAHLAALPDADVAGLLTARPDLIAPPSASFTALAARAGARPSVVWSPRASSPVWSGSPGSPW